MTARLSFALALVLIGAAGAVAQLGPVANSDASIEAASSIPPNCTLNPWTHKFVCHKWPKGTKSRA